MAQQSFLNVMFGNMFANAVLATAVSLTLTRGFFSAWPWIVCLGFISDMLSVEVVGITSLVLMIFSYGISFLSRRFLVEHKASGIGLATVFTVIVSFLYLPLMWSIRHAVFDTVLSGEILARYFSDARIVFGIILNALVFMVVYGIVLKLSQILDFYEDRVVVK